MATADLCTEEVCAFCGYRGVLEFHECTIILSPKTFDSLKEDLRKLHMGIPINKPPEPEHTTLTPGQKVLVEAVVDMYGECGHAFEFCVEFRKGVSFIYYQAFYHQDGEPVIHDNYEDDKDYRPYSK